MVAKLKGDVLLEKGMAGILIEGEHPVTGEAVMREDFIPAAEFARNRPGIISFAKRAMKGKLHDLHGDATLEDITLALFADVVKAKDEAFVIESLAQVSESAKRALAVAQVQRWRSALDKLAIDGKPVQETAKSLYGEFEDAQAAVAVIEAEIEALETAVAEELQISKVFDITLVDSGFYIPEETTSSSGTKSKVSRDWLAADEYTHEGKIGPSKVPFKGTAAITNRSDENPAVGDWTCAYVADGKTYTGKAENGYMNEAVTEARKLLLAVHNPDGKPSLNCPEAFGVPKVLVQADVS